MMSLDVSDGKSRRVFLDALDQFSRESAEENNRDMLAQTTQKAVVAAYVSRGRSAVLLPDVPARIAWISVNERMGYIIPREIVRMIGEYVTFAMVACAYGPCDVFFKEGWGHGKDEKFCSDVCADRFQAYDPYAHAVAPSGYWIYPQGTIELVPRSGLGKALAAFVVTQERRRADTRATMVLLRGNCKICKKKITTDFDQDGYCGKACFKKRWKK